MASRPLTLLQRAVLARRHWAQESATSRLDRGRGAARVRAVAADEGQAGNSLRPPSSVPSQWIGVFAAFPYLAMAL